MSTPKNRPFKKFFCDRPEVFLLPPAAFKIWLYHYSREGPVRESWPGIKTLCEKLHMDRHSVCTWRGWLTENGWLERIGERQVGSGRFSVPVFKAKRGSIPAKNPDGRALNRVRKLSTQIGVKTSHADQCENFALEVDSEKQVDEISVRGTSGREISASPRAYRLAAHHSPRWRTRDSGTLVLRLRQMVRKYLHSARLHGGSVHWH